MLRSLFKEVEVYILAAAYENDIRAKYENYCTII
jgi:hypothetical protein